MFIQWSWQQACNTVKWRLDTNSYKYTIIYIWLHMYIYICLSICLSVCLSIYQSINLSIYPSISIYSWTSSATTYLQTKSPYGSCSALFLSYAELNSPLVPGRLNWSPMFEAAASTRKNQSCLWPQGSQLWLIGHPFFAFFLFFSKLLFRHLHQSHRLRRLGCCHCLSRRPQRSVSAASSGADEAGHQHGDRQQGEERQQHAAGHVGRCFGAKGRS